MQILLLMLALAVFPEALESSVASTRHHGCTDGMLPNDVCATVPPAAPPVEE